MFFGFFDIIRARDKRDMKRGEKNSTFWKREREGREREDREKEWKKKERKRVWKRRKRELF